MFLYFYQISLVIFLLQGISIPFLIIGAGLLWWRQSARLAALDHEVRSAKGKESQRGAIESIIARLPKLKPLNCTACGACVLLRPNETLCPHCGVHGPLPENYAAAVSLKSQLKGLVKSAVRNWRAANFLTHPIVAWIFFLLIFVEPLVIFPAVIIGSNVYPNTWFDKAFTKMGETSVFLIMLSAFLGFVIWMVVFIFLNTMSKSLRKNLPLKPALETQAVSGSETGNCQACGGGTEYAGGAFACLCGYCNVENFRVQFVSRERAKGESQKTKTKSTLFGAMQIVEDFTGTLFFVLTILVGASVLLTLFYAVKNAI